MNLSEKTLSADGEFGRGATSPGQSLARALLSALFLVSSFPLGLIWSVALLVLVLVGVPLALVRTGLPVYAPAMLACAYGVRVERWRQRVLLGNRLTSPYRPLPHGSVVVRARARAADPALSRSLLYLALLIPVGLVEVVIVLLLALAASLIAYPLYFWTFPERMGVVAPAFVADTLPEALLVALVGLVLGSAAAVFGMQVSGAHAALGRRLLGKREGLEERVEALTESRSKAVRAAIAERRRIERDLHDGAQQRLVSLAMALGMAKEKMKDSPDAAARDLVGEAHEEAKLALAEIRDLIRGIHPAVLTDRGLDAAISALAGRSVIPTVVDVELGERPPDAVEITAYFVIAEALANVVRHSDASEARVSVRREGDLLVAEIEDDGVGGADPTGNGLAGLADRALVLDGRLTVESPAGGPTRVRVELPWGDSRGDQDGG